MTGPPDRGQTVAMEALTLTDLLARLAHRWRVLAAGAALGLVVGVGVTALLPRHYSATSVVLVDATDPARIDMAAEAVVASSRRVTTEALDAIGDRRLTIAALERAASTTAVDDSRLLRVEHVARDPRAAARGADALAQAYLAVRSLDPPVDDGGRFTGSVVDPARTPTSPTGPAPGATVVGAATLGSLLAAAAAVVRPSRSPAARAS